MSSKYTIDNPLPRGTRVYVPMVKVYGTIIGTSDEFYLIAADEPVAIELAVMDKHGTPLTERERRAWEQQKRDRLLLSADEIEVIP